MWQKIKHFFIPCEENTFRPHFLERFSMGIMLCMVLLTFAMANIQALVWIGSEWMVSTILPAVIVELTNEERTVGALGKLRRNDLLDIAAQLKAEDMVRNGYFAHHSPAGISPWHWFEVAGYNYVHAGENLAVHFTDSGDVVRAWMKSPTHRDNIMNGTYQEIGIGTARGEYKGTPTVFVVQLFGTAKTPSVPVVAMDIPTVRQEVSSPNASVVTVPVQTPEVLAEQTIIEEVAIETVTDAEESSLTQPAELMYETTLTEELYEDTFVVYSGLASTSRPGVPAVIDSDTLNGTTEKHLNFFERSATQPSLWLQYVYGLMAFIVVLALSISVIVEWRRQNLLHMVYTGGLLVVMAGLLHVHTALTSGVTIL